MRDLSNTADVQNELNVSNFNDFLSPFNFDYFLQEYWENKLLHIKRNNSDYYKSLFSIEEVDALLDSNNLTSEHVKVVKNQEYLTRNRYEHLDKSIYLNQLYSHYSDGYTIVMNEMDLFWNPLKSLCRSISNSTSCPTNAKMFFSPKDSQGLFPHFDTHDVYILQIHGKKYWTLYDAPVETPMTASQQMVFQKEQLSNPKVKTLEAGDMMYIPRGVPHEAFTSDESSLHITICVYPTQWIDLLTKSIQQLAHTNLALRKSLPFGYLNNDSWTSDLAKNFNTKFQELLKEETPKATLGHGMILLSEEKRNKQKVSLDGHFRELDKIDKLNLETILRKREGMNCSVQVIGNFCRIIYPGNVIKGPAKIEEAFQFIASNNKPFRLNDIPSVSDSNKVKLAARLIRGGLLRIKQKV